MPLTEHESALLDAIYGSTRIPIFIYDASGALSDRFFAEAQVSLADVLYRYAGSVAMQHLGTDFELLYRGGELFSAFSFGGAMGKNLCLCGPMLLPGERAGTLSFLTPDADSAGWEGVLPLITLPGLYANLRLVMLALGRTPPEEQALCLYRPFQLQSSSRPLFIRELFENREEQSRGHTPYREEIKLLSCVRAGDLARLEAFYKAQPKIKYGKMSSNPLRQMFFGCIANVTLVTRYAIEGGMDEEGAFTLSDAYIRRMESCTSVLALEALSEEMAAEFTGEVAKLNRLRPGAYSAPVARCMDYIALNLHGKITLEQLSAETGFSPKYLSRLFALQTGGTLSAYISKKRVEEAMSLLVCTDYSYSHICHCLNFSSHSYFISVFKKTTGMTPKAYREKHAYAPTGRGVSI